MKNSLGKSKGNGDWCHLTETNLASRSHSRESGNPVRRQGIPEAFRSRFPLSREGSIRSLFFLPSRAVQPLRLELRRQLAVDFAERLLVLVDGGGGVAVLERLISLAELFELVIGNQELYERGSLRITDGGLAFLRADIGEGKKFVQRYKFPLVSMRHDRLIHFLARRAQGFQRVSTHKLRNVDCEAFVEKGGWAAESSGQDVGQLMVRVKLCLFVINLHNGAIKRPPVAGMPRVASFRFTVGEKEEADGFGIDDAEQLRDFPESRFPLCGDGARVSGRKGRWEEINAEVLTVTFLEALREIVVYGFVSLADELFLLKEEFSKLSNAAGSHLGEEEPDAQRGLRRQMRELVFRLDFPFALRPYKEEKLHLPPVRPNSRLSSQIQP